MYKGVFLDRDGVINKAIIRNGKPFAPSNLKEFEVLDGVKEAISSLQNANFKIIIVSNQPDISRGKTSLNQVNQFHSIIRDQLNIHNFYVCPHDDCHECSCRKPNTGMLIQSALDNDINLSVSYLIGDRWRDIEAGQKAGCKCFFISNSYKEKKPSKPYIMVDSLLEASQIILDLE